MRAPSGRGTDVRYTGKCRKCGAFTSAESTGNNGQKGEADATRTGGVYFNPWRYWGARCRACNAEIGVKPVHGKLSERKKCDARCMHAKGFSCECSCAGENHGAGFSA